MKHPSCKSHRVVFADFPIQGDMDIFGDARYTLFATETFLKQQFLQIPMESPWEKGRNAMEIGHFFMNAFAERSRLMSLILPCSPRSPSTQGNLKKSR